MGENEQGGMLRTVVVVGLVALIAGVIFAGVVGMKASMTKNTDRAADTAAPNMVKDSNFRGINAELDNVDSYHQLEARFKQGTWVIGGEYKGTPYLEHIAEAGETRSDIISQRVEIPNDKKYVSYGVWVKGRGIVQMSGYETNDPQNAGDSWHGFWTINAPDWTYVTENNVWLDAGSYLNAKYISMDIISLGGDKIAFTQPMFKFTKTLGDGTYMPTS